MYFLDTKQHKAPHIHVRFQNDEAVIAIPSGDVLDGMVPEAKLRLVKAWVEIHRDELMADWTLASSGQPIFKIEPLR